MQIENEDLRNGQEIRQDAFEDFMKKGKIGQKARIIFCGDEIEVKLILRTKNGVATLKYLGEPRSDIPERIAMNLQTMHENDDSELVELI